MKSELEEFGVQVATINPGAFNTGFNDRAAEEKWKWFDEFKHFTSMEDMKKQEEELGNQFEQEDMIEKMIEIIPADHHNFRTVYPEETEKQLKKTEKERWDMEI
jgi:DNA-directed RNA polymerase subunit F